MLLGCCPFFQITPPEDIEVQDFRECFRSVAPAMLVLLSWTYVGLANVNMVWVMQQLLRALARIPREIGLIYLQWTSLSHLVIFHLQEFFNCTYKSGKYFLAAEPSIECYDFTSWNQHTALFPIAVAGMVVYVMGIPVLFGSLLFLNRKVMHVHQRFRILPCLAAVVEVTKQ